ncbi:exostosin family protein [Prunus dulcis]|uniref:Exostosin family protein n=1 Tax=Prunus dulcis TaxID=3755 RepID=A0A5H2XPM4_PRUDU|nr:exostosin family protein [Prunus dulcis]
MEHVVDTSGLELQWLKGMPHLSRESQNDVEPSVGNRSILVDKEEEEKPTISSQDKEASQANNDVKCNTNGKLALKVFMYDLPHEFHFGLLDWKPQGRSVWPDLQTKVPAYPGGLNLQHSIEYWLTLDILASELPNPPNVRTAIRVQNSSEADIIFIPFFSSLSYNRFSKINPHQKKSNNKLLQDKLVKYVTAQQEWKISGGRDHLIVAHHPNSLLDGRMKLWPATFILSDFGRYPPNIANVEKDIIAPYKHVIKSYVNDSSTFDSRPTLLYFQGAIYRKDCRGQESNRSCTDLSVHVVFDCELGALEMAYIEEMIQHLRRCTDINFLHHLRRTFNGGFVRQELFYLLQDEKDVHFTFGSVQKDGIKKASQGMHTSKFCLNIAGDTPSSNRLFDAIASHCVPVIISDDIELPYEDVLDYSESIGMDEWTQMWRRLQEVQKFYEFQYPSKEGDAVQMIWQAVARKVPAIRMKLNKSRRFSRSYVRKEKGLSRIPSPSNFCIFSKE